MTDLKAGDVVICVHNDDAPDLTVGAEYTVSSVFMGYRISHDGIPDFSSKLQAAVTLVELPPNALRYGWDQHHFEKKPRKIDMEKFMRLVMAPVYIPVEEPEHV